MNYSHFIDTLTSRVTDGLECSPNMCILGSHREPPTGGFVVYSVKSSIELLCMCQFTKEFGWPS